MTEHHSFVGLPVPVESDRDAALYRPIRARVVARLFPNRLDRHLAVGAAAPAGSALAIHAARLRSDGERHAIARVLRRAVDDAQPVRPPWQACVPFNRRNVVAAEDVIDTITLRLHSPRNVQARGMARLRLLLTDGYGPLYEGGRGDLDGRLRAALAAL